MNATDVFDCQFQPAIYDGCGNKVLIVVLSEVSTKDYQDDRRIREKLREMGLAADVDSVLVVTGNPERLDLQGCHCTMEVFEPRGHDSAHPELAGSWSTMCGNGIRALAQYWLDRIPGFERQGMISIRTRSGKRAVRRLPDGRFRVYMGVYTDHPTDLERYVEFSHFNFKDKHYQGSRFLEQLGMMSVRLPIVDAGIGLTGDPDGSGAIDGEPHLVCWLAQRADLSIHDIERVARLLGERLTRDPRFPQEINVSAAVRQENEVVLAATYERGVYYVTRACGTGATVIGCQSGEFQTRIQMPGGDLEVEIRGLRSFLIGPASAVEEGKV